MDAYLAANERWVDHQVDRGLLRVCPGRDERGGTFELGLRSALCFFNPFADRFTVWRLALGLLAGLAPPALAALLLAGPEAPWVSQLRLGSGLAELLVLGPSILVSAAAVGWVFETRAIVWSPIVACLAGSWCCPRRSGTPACARPGPWCSSPRPGSPTPCRTPATVAKPSPEPPAGPPEGRGSEIGLPWRGRICYPLCSRSPGGR